MVRIQKINKVSKPWGYELIVERTQKYALKDIFLKKDTRSSLQSHIQKLETILVIEGELNLETWSDTGDLHQEKYSAGEAYTIPVGMRHRVTAITDVRVIEVSTPELEDVVRHQDDFGRTS